MKWIALSIFLFSFNVLAHPVAYEGAFSFMSINSRDMSENTLVYSPKYWLGTGVKHVEGKDSKWTNAHLGFLAKRWNEFHSQGNFYLFGGPGVVWNRQQSDYFTRYGMQLDWETRRIYTMFKTSIADSKKFGTEQDYEGRIGFAPYLAGFDDFNSWMILQVTHVPGREQEVQVTPLLRMFYQNVLWEVGSSFQGNWLLNLMVRY